MVKRENNAHGVLVKVNEYARHSFDFTGFTAFTAMTETQK